MLDAHQIQPSIQWIYNEGQCLFEGAAYDTLDIESKISAVDCTDICILRRVGFNLVLYEPKTMSECFRRSSFFIIWYLQKRDNLDVGENQRLSTLKTETMSVSHLSVVVFNFKYF